MFFSRGDTMVQNNDFIELLKTNITLGEQEREKKRKEEQINNVIDYNSFKQIYEELIKEVLSELAFNGIKTIELDDIILKIRLLQIKKTETRFPPSSSYLWKNEYKEYVMQILEKLGLKQITIQKPVFKRLISVIAYTWS